MIGTLIFIAIICVIINYTNKLWIKWKENEAITWSIVSYSLLTAAIVYFGIIIPFFGFYHIWSGITLDEIPRGEYSLWDSYWDSCIKFITLDYNISESTKLTISLVALAIIAITSVLTIIAKKHPLTFNTFISKLLKLRTIYICAICIPGCFSAGIYLLDGIGSETSNLDNSSYNYSSTDNYPYSYSSDSYSSTNSSYRTSSETTYNSPSTQEESWWDKHGDTVCDVAELGAKALNWYMNNKPSDTREYDVYVREYTRKDGTHVDAYYRRRPK